MQTGGNLLKHPNRILITNEDDIKQFRYGQEDSEHVLYGYGLRLLRSEITAKKKLITTSGTAKVVVGEVKPRYPSEDEYEAWLKIVSKKQLKRNPLSVRTPSDFYNYVIENLQSASGLYLNNTANTGDIALIVDNLIKDIVSDKNAIVDAGRVYEFTASAAGTISSITIGSTQYDSSATANANTKRNELVTAINAGTQAYAYALSGTGKLYVVKKAGNTEAVAATAEITLDTATTTHLLGLVAKDDKEPFEIQRESDFFASLTTVVEASFPQLTYDDVLNLFPIKPGDAGMVPNYPVKGDYNLYRITTKNSQHPGLTGASSVEQREQVTEIYVLDSLVDTAYWSADYKVLGSTNDFEDLLQAWSNVDPDSW